MAKKLITDGDKKIAEAIIPDNWVSTYNLNEKLYFGSLNPLGFSFKVTSPSGEDFISAFSPRNYVDIKDNAGDKKELTMIEDSEDIFRRYMSPEDFADDFMKALSPGRFILKEQRYPAVEDLEELERVRVSRKADYAKALSQLKNEFEEYSPGEYYYNAAIRIYDAIKDGKAYRYALHCCIEASDVATKETLSGGDIKLKDERVWTVFLIFALRSAPERFEENYNAYLDFCNSYKYGDYIKERLAAAQQKIQEKAEERLKAKRKAAAAPKTQVFCDEQGVAFIEALVPRGWKASGRRIKGYYGYNYPFGYTAKIEDPSRSSYIAYSNPINYEQDSRYPKEKLTVTDYNVLLRDFVGVEEFLDETAKKTIGEYELFRLEASLPAVFSPQADYGRITEKEYERLKEELAGTYPDDVLHSCYIKALSRVYSYMYKGVKRMRVITAKIDSDERTQHSEIPVPDSMKGDPYWKNFFKSQSPGFFIDEKGRYMQLFRRVNFWFVNNRTEMDCPADKFDELYGGVYKDFACSVKQREEMTLERKRAMALKDREKEAVRADKEQARRIYLQTEMNRIESAKQTADYVRQKNNEISNIISSTYENTSRVQERANRRWSEAFNGYSRYSDRYGDIYRVDNRGKYAYKKGTTIISTDDPVSPGADWEELKKEY
ncbi:MAG: hypothetical protein GX061_07890 [Eubacteriaceae bacterium]|nr:hypothetical protein [Eubacteriaceae bacterium]